LTVGFALVAMLHFPFGLARIEPFNAYVVR
jgi:hypothetical protein